MQRSNRADSSQMSAFQAHRKYGVSPKQWIAIDDDIARQVVTLEEFDELVLAEAARRGLDGTQSLSFRYPEHLISQLAGHYDSEDGSSSPAIRTSSTGLADFSSHGVDRRGFAKRSLQASAAVLAFLVLGRSSTRDAAADHLCACCRWRKSFNCCYSDWYSIQCSSYCCTQYSFCCSSNCSNCGSCYDYPGTCTP